MRIEVWSDVICPWCYIGSRRLATAIERFEHPVEVTWRSYQLDPTHRRGDNEPTQQMLAKKMNASPAQVDAMQAQVTALAAAEGLDYHLERSITASTFDAHRLVHLAEEQYLGAAMNERLMRANLCEGEIVDDADTLVRLGVEVGLGEEDVRGLLAGDTHADAVRADIAEARELGVSGVPFFVFDRAYGLSGAQSVEVFTSALEQAHAAAV